MERNAVIKIRRPTASEQEAFDRTMNYDRFDAGKMHGRVQSGPPFVGDVTIAVIGNVYGLELVTRVLRAACIPYSVETGRLVKRRKKECGSSTQFTLTMVAITAELVSDQPTASESTTPESATAPAADDGSTCS